MISGIVNHPILRGVFAGLAFILIPDPTTAQVTSTAEAYKSLTFFSDAFNQVRSNYIDEVPPSKLVESAIAGMLSSLDPHSTYLDSAEFRLFRSLTEGNAIDVGIELEIIDGAPFIVSLIDGSPASRSTLVPGDVLTKINDDMTYDRTVPELRLMLMGKKGSEVRVTVRKPVTNEEIVVVLVREDIAVKTIAFSTMLTSEIGYIRISRFGIKTAEEYGTAIGDLRRHNLKHLVLDLRGNPGGVMEAALGILDMYIPEGEMIARVAARKAVANETTYATDRRKEPSYSISVLINQSSASASELVAGTLQDFDRALIVGNNSFGKGLVQSTFFLSNKGVLLMTIGKYYTASGRCLQREYKGRNKFEYYSEIFTADSLSHSDTLQFRTRSGRAIYGASGVNPDVRVASSQLDLLRKIDRSGAAVQWAAKHRPVSVAGYSTFDKFQKNFNISDQAIGEFIGTCNQFRLDTTVLWKNVDFIRVLLKSEIASLQWGQKEAIQISKEFDPILQEAIASIPKAEALLSGKKNSK